MNKERPPTQEIGRPVTREGLLNYIRRHAGSWLRDILAKDPNAKCTCGSCHLCYFRFAEALERDEKRRAALEEIKKLGQRAHDLTFGPSDTYESELDAIRSLGNAILELDALALTPAPEEKGGR